MPTCPREGCPGQVPLDQLACRRHWYAVSPRTRAWVSRAYRDGTDDLRAAITAAIDEMNAKPL